MEIEHKCRSRQKLIKRLGETNCIVVADIVFTGYKPEWYSITTMRATPIRHCPYCGEKLNKPQGA